MSRSPAHSPEDIEMARQMLTDLNTLITGATKDIMSRGGYAANPHAATLLGCLLSVSAAAALGGRDIYEAYEALSNATERTVARHGWIEDTKDAK